MIRREALIIISFLGILFAFQDLRAGTMPIESLIPKTAPEGWILRDAPETFTRETLFEHINGQADLFVQYGFENSVFAVYQNTSSSEDKIEVDIYDMGDSLHAYGVFSRFRQEEKPAGIGLDSYLGDNYAIFYKGKYFVVLQATDSNAILKRLAQDIESRISDTSAQPRELGYFPTNGLKPGSIEYFPDGLLGHQFLHRGFKASYTEQEAKTSGKARGNVPECHLFLAVFKNSEEALDALQLYREDLLKKGKLDTGTLTQFGPNSLIGTDPYQGKTVVVQKGPYLLGAAGFQQDREGQERLAEMMREIK
ncbi:DUF6599 family protein [Desulfomonile tiedjei]|uniref:Uncharacterized protein n=1 Tax=Desulfomonile tiedjei (strain ATCC 49306 / DSM 6799 / DCB-1) TaxID=706587 RepID=I4C4U1_DESTA|nr:DUF6599 family protein [Desulfomonile tiedjei]AFM24582.1 hypothetical protein Desti_1874 [Desulfomonile tiedjei DSM 6799]